MVRFSPLSPLSTVIFFFLILIQLSDQVKEVWQTVRAGNGKMNHRSTGEEIMKI